MPQYTCDLCGACCRGSLIVEAETIDVMREPRLVEADPHYRGKRLSVVLQLLEEERRCLVIGAGSARSCPFLGMDNCCSIYPTRPNCCVGLQAGDEQCQDARRAAGLAPLEPIDGPNDSGARTPRKYTVIEEVRYAVEAGNEEEAIRIISESPDRDRYCVGVDERYATEYEEED